MQALDRGRQPLPELARQQHGDEEAKTGYRGVSSSRIRRTIDT